MKTKNLLFVLPILLLIILGSKCSGFSHQDITRTTDGQTTEAVKKYQETQELSTHVSEFRPTLVKPTETVISTVTFRQGLKINTDGLPIGQYVVFYDLEGENQIYALNLQGKAYPIGVSDDIYSQSINSRVIFSKNKIRINDSNTPIFLDLPETKENCRLFSATNDGSLFAAACDNESTWVYRYYEGTIEQIIQLDKSYYPFLSPQGGKIAYTDKDNGRIYIGELSSSSVINVIKTIFNGGNRLFWSPDGVSFGVNYGTLISIQNIGRADIFELTSDKGSFNGFTWFPDNKNIAYVLNTYGEDNEDISEIHVLKLDEEQDFILYEDNGLLEMTGWLNIHSKFHKGGKYITLPQENELYLLSTYGEGEEPVYQLQEGDDVTILDQYQDIGEERWWLVESDNLQGWILETKDYFQDDWESDLKPAMFQVGSHLVVTTDGEDLRLRETASINGEIIRKLQPGVRLSVIDGPLKIDGYTWWKVALDESNVEGWVAEESSWFGSIPEE